MRQHEEQMNNKSMNASREGVAPERPGGDEWEGEEGDVEERARERKAERAGERQCERETERERERETSDVKRADCIESPKWISSPFKRDSRERTFTFPGRTDLAK